MIGGDIKKNWCCIEGTTCSSVGKGGMLVFPHALIMSYNLQHGPAERMKRLCLTNGMYTFHFCATA